MTILFPGAVVFRHDETGSQVIAIVAFTAGIVLLHALDARQRRREGRE
jgi:uncharacterized membrane protein